MLRLEVKEAPIIQARRAQWIVLSAPCGATVLVAGGGTGFYPSGLAE